MIEALSSVALNNLGAGLWLGSVVLIGYLLYTIGEGRLKKVKSDSENEISKVREDIEHKMTLTSIDITEKFSKVDSNHKFIEQKVGSIEYKLGELSSYMNSNGATTNVIKQKIDLVLVHLGENPIKMAKEL